MALSLNVLGLLNVTTGQTQSGTTTTPSISFVQVTGVSAPAAAALTVDGFYGVATLAIPGLQVGDALFSWTATDANGVTTHKGPIGSVSPVDGPWLTADNGLATDFGSCLASVVTTADQLGWVEWDNPSAIDYSGYTFTLTFLRGLSV